MTLEILRQKLKEANEAYRLGVPFLSDVQYDRLVVQLERLSPNDPMLFEIGHLVSDSRKSKLPIIMASMNKIKTIEEYIKWIESKSLTSSIMVITPKYDGISLCVDESKLNAWTRGDGEYGQASDPHFKLMNNRFKTKHPIISYGEAIMSKNTFNDKFNDYSNPRNLVGGLLNSNDVSDNLQSVDYIRFGLNSSEVAFNTKEELLTFLNSEQKIQVPFLLIKSSEINEELLIDLYNKWSIEYEIDGVIIEVNDINKQNELGREITNNPAYARAFKHDSFNQSKESTVTGITWNISKQGYLKPIIQIEPIELDGVIVSNVTGNNARYVKEMGIGINAKIMVKRSGMVIPMITEVIEPIDFEMPVGDIIWNKSGIELMTMSETDEQRIKQAVAFFEILEADNISIGTIRQLWEHGFDSIENILNASKEDFEKVDRFGKRKAEIVFNSIRKSTTNVRLSKLQHATGIFSNLGSKKLILLEHFKTKPTISEVLKVKGFAEKSATEYVSKYDEFFEYISKLNVTILDEEKSLNDNDMDLKDIRFVFTGVRRKDLNDIIESRGGIINTSVSSKTNYLVMKEIGSGSSKEKNAIELGVKIISISDLEKLLST